MNASKPKNKMANAKFFAMALLLLLVFGSVGLAYGTVEKTQTQTAESPENGNIPGAANDSLQYNRTDVTPTGQMEQVRAMETNIFNYRNVTVMLNCTRNCELNITIDQAVKPKILSLSIDPNQTMQLSLNMTANPPVGEMVQERNLNMYLGLEPNATLQLAAQIRLQINATQLNEELNREVNASQLTWMYWNTTSNEWVPVPSWIDQNNYLVCNTTHFSTWTVAELSTESPVSITATDSSQPDNSPTQTQSPISSTTPLETPTISNSIQTPAPTEINSSSPLAATSPATELGQQKSATVEYLYEIAIGIVAVVVIIAVIVYKKNKH